MGYFMAKNSFVAELTFKQLNDIQREKPRNENNYLQGLLKIQLWLFLIISLSDYIIIKISQFQGVMIKKFHNKMEMFKHLWKGLRRFIRK